MHRSRTAARRRELPHARRGTSLAFVSLCLLGTIPLYGADAEVNITVQKLLDFRKPLPRHVTCFPNTNHLFVYHLFQKPNLVYQWDIKQKKVLKTYDLGAGFICDHIRVSPKGRFSLIVGSTQQDFSAKALLIDNRHRTLIRTIPIRDDVSVVTHVQFSTNEQSFILTTNFRNTVGYDTTGARLAHIDASEYGEPKNERVRNVGAAKGRDPNTEGLYYRDDSGQEKRLHSHGVDSDFVITKDGRYLAAGYRGELLIWRLSDGQQVFRRALAKQAGFVAYCAGDNLILWVDVDGGELLGISIRPATP